MVPDGTALDKALEIAEVINNNGPLAVQAILKTIHETEGMHELDAFKLDTEDRHPGVPVRRRQGGPAGVQGEAGAQLPDEVAAARFPRQMPKIGTSAFSAARIAAIASRSARTSTP